MEKVLLLKEIKLFFVTSWVSNNKSVIKIVLLQSLCLIWGCCLGVTCYKGPKMFPNKPKSHIEKNGK